VVARQDRAIRSPGDLRGRRIGLTTGTSAHFWLDSFLLRHQLVLADVHLQHVPAEGLAAALASGEVDAVATWQPYLDVAQDAVGNNGVLLTMAGIYDAPWSLAGLSDFPSRRPEALRRLLRALLRAERIYAEDPDAALATIAKVRGIRVAALRPQLADFRFALRLDQSLLGALEDESRWAMRSGIVPLRPMPNYLAHVHLDSLATVEPARVHVIR
jgi:NitT/TauT family transport system substrate-binding protein